MLGNMLNDLAEAIRRWTGKKKSRNQGSRIPEITKSSRSGMTFTLTLRSKRRQRRVATKVVRKERTVKQEGETWSSVKMTAKATALRAHSESAQ